MGWTAFCLPLAFSDWVVLAGVGAAADLDLREDLIGTAGIGTWAGASPSKRTSTVAFLLYGAERGLEPFDLDLPCLPMTIRLLLCMAKSTWTRLRGAKLIFLAVPE